MATKITNCKIITPQGILENHCLIFSNGKITDIVPETGNNNYQQVINANGHYVAPGNIDIHIHGGGGSDFHDGSAESFYTVARTHAIHGTTSMLATMDSSSYEKMKESIKICESIMNDPKDGAKILGMHFEGPYLSPNMVGGQDARYITPPKPEEYQEIIISTKVLKRWSAAPEVEGALEFGRYAKEHGIVVALAHTQADFDDVKAGREVGYNLATHFYNAMTGVHKNREFKKEGTVESVFCYDDIDVEVIADGIHVPPTILKMIYKFKGADHVALCTDSQSVTDAPSSKVDPRFVIEDGVVKLADRSALAGSCCTTDRLIRTMVQKADVPITEAVKMASATPARIIGMLDRKGTLEKGKDADIIIFDDEINIKTTIVEGKVIYQA